VLCAAPAFAVAPVFDPTGGFYDMPFPHELRRDPDGTVALSGFPYIPNGIVTAYINSLDEVPGFGLNSGVFLKFDGAVDPASLPADPDLSRLPGASVFLINIDPGSKLRGHRTPLWLDFRAAADAYRDANSLVAMPVPGHPLEPATLYALVVTDDLMGVDTLPVSTAALIQRMKDEAPQGAFETAALPLYRTLWRQLEDHEGMSRNDVVTATVYRTYAPAEGMFATARVVRREYQQTPTNLAFFEDRGTFWLFSGDMIAPQFQAGAPPFSVAGSGKFVFDAEGAPVVQREDTLQFFLAVPKETTDGTIAMPRRGWPIVHYMHGTGGDRLSFVRDGTAGRLAAVGVASLGVDQPLHGLRPGGTPDGINFYNPLNPYALRDNPRQAAADSLTVHEMLPRIRIEPELITVAPGASYQLPTRPIVFRRGTRMAMGHSQGATTVPLFLAVSKSVRAGIISAGGGHIIVNILTREEEFFAGQKLRDLVQLLVGAPLDVFHPALHMLQMGSDVSDPVTYAPYFATRLKGKPLNMLFTHGLLDGYVTTPMTAAMVAAARYPLVAPTFPPMTFPLLPGYSYQETFDLAGLATLTAPVSRNIGQGKRSATGGMLLYQNDGHFPIFQNAMTIAQFKEFVRSLAYDGSAVIAP
jgi:hypothetical protein